MKRLKNENNHLKAQSACHKENVVVAVNKALEKERVITTKKVASITTSVNKMSDRLSAARNRNLVMNKTNKNKIVNLKDQYNTELDRVRNRLEEKHNVACLTSELVAVLSALLLRRLNHVLFLMIHLLV